MSTEKKLEVTVTQSAEGGGQARSVLLGFGVLVGRVRSEHVRLMMLALVPVMQMEARTSHFLGTSQEGAVRVDCFSYRERH